MLIDERNRCAPPIDDGVVLVQPRHAKDDIVAAEHGDGERSGILIRIETDGGSIEHAGGRLLTAIGKDDGRKRGIGANVEAMTTDEIGGNEVTGGAGVDEEGSRMRAQAASQLNETTTR